MELEDLKTAWQSVKPHIDSQISEEASRKIILKKNDIKSRLLQRILWDGIFTIICLVLMATSSVWSPLKLPLWWLIALCSTIFIALLYGVKIYISIKSINLWDDTSKGILTTIVSIKKLYRNIEFATAIVIIPLLIWLSFTPLFIHTWSMFFVWGLTLFGFALEYLWYRSNIKRCNSLVDWEKEEL